MEAYTVAWDGFCLLIKLKNFYRGNKRQQCHLIYCLFYIALLRLGYKPDEKEHKMMRKWRVNSAPLKYSSFFFPLPCSSGPCQWPTSHNHAALTLSAHSAKLEREIPVKGTVQDTPGMFLMSLGQSHPPSVLDLSQLFILLCPSLRYTQESALGKLSSICSELHFFDIHNYDLCQQIMEAWN